MLSLNIIDIWIIPEIRSSNNSSWIIELQLKHQQCEEKHKLVLTSIMFRFGRI